MLDNEELNLSEKLFSRVRKVQETSTISNSAESLDPSQCEQVLTEGICSSACNSRRVAIGILKKTCASRMPCRP